MPTRSDGGDRRVGALERGEVFAPEFPLRAQGPGAGVEYAGEDSASELFSGEREVPHRGSAGLRIRESPRSRARSVAAHDAGLPPHAPPAGGPAAAGGFAPR